MSAASTTLTPLYQYLQGLLLIGKPFTIHLTDGGQLSVSAGNASLNKQGALVVKVDNRSRVINESSIVHVSHDGGFVQLP